jgi:hypothetical protein
VTKKNEKIKDFSAKPPSKYYLLAELIEGVWKAFQADRHNTKVTQPI